MSSLSIFFRRQRYKVLLVVLLCCCLLFFKIILNSTAHCIADATQRFALLKKINLNYEQIETTGLETLRVSSRHNERFRDQLRRHYNTMPTGLGNDDKKNADKYFIYRCDDSGTCGGWADRMKGTLMAYLIANLTGRTFKMEIKSPACDLQDYIIPNLVNWSLPVSFHPKILNDENVYLMNMVPNRKSFLFYDSVKNTNFTALPMNSFKYVYFKSNLEYSDGLKASRFHHNQLSWMDAMTRDQINSAMYRRLIRLSPRLQNRLDEILNTALPNPEDQLVCAHLRMGKGLQMPGERVQNTLDVLPTVWSFLGNYSKTRNNKLFIMSDSEQVIQEAKRQSFGKELLTVPGSIIHVEKSSNLKVETRCELQEKVVLEHFLLMHCDVLLISRSGLSRLPAYIRGSNEGLFCLFKGTIIPCKMETLKELYDIRG